MNKMTLTPKQEAFCNKYLECGDATQAYRFAYDTQRMADRTCNNKAAILRKHKKVAARIAELQAESKERSDYKKDDAVKELANIINTNVLDFIAIEDNSGIKVSEDGVLSTSSQSVIVKDLDQLTESQQKCIKSIAPVRGGIKIEFHDKIQAIDRLSKLLGWDTPEKVEHSGIVNANISIVPLKKGKQTFASNEDEIDK